MDACTLIRTLTTLLSSGDKTPIMLLGPPGVGKSSIVKQVADQLTLQVLDLRLGQIPPSDIRGLPMIVDGVSTYARPEWLPLEGAGVLFMDELTNAAPAVQGLSQQLLLDRRVGEHQLGEDWFVIGAGNAREHGASTHAMPTPVANRMIHFSLEADLDSWKPYAMKQNVHPDVVGFLSFRPELLFHLDRKQPAFPTPRSWETASRLHRLGIDVIPAVGQAAGDEFRVYCDVVAELPDLEPILAGTGGSIPFPNEMSARYATCVGLAMRCRNEHEALRAFSWLDESSGPEWVQLFVADVMVRLEQLGCLGPFAAKVTTNKNLQRFVQNALQTVFA